MCEFVFFFAILVNQNMDVPGKSKLVKSAWCMLQGLKAMPDVFLGSDHDLFP